MQVGAAGVVVRIGNGNALPKTKTLPARAGNGEGGSDADNGTPRLENIIIDSLVHVVERKDVATCLTTVHQRTSATECIARYMCGELYVARARA